MCWTRIPGVVPTIGLLLAILTESSSAVTETNPLIDVKDSINKMSETMADSLDEIIDRSTLAGQISPLLRKFILSNEQREAIWQGITHVASVSDVVFLMILGFALVPSVEVPYTRFVLSRNSKDTKRQFDSTKMYHLANSLSQIARLAFAVYAFDMVKIVFVGAGFQIPRRDRLTHAFAYVLYTVWGAHRLMRIKRYFLKKLFFHGRSGRGNDLEGRMQVVDRLVNAVLAMCAGMIILDMLNLELGLAMRGFVAFGSVGTLVFSLAAKDTVANLLQGIILSASDRIYEGDSIQLQKSGYSGSVHKMGWLDTVLRGSDEIMVTIPNADLLSQRVSNLSRIHQSQVKQTLRFRYEDSEKLPQLLEDIKTEIRTSCPAVITDGSRPFRCFWTGYQPGYLEVTVDAHFRIKPVGDAFHENRQRTLQAINRAVQKNSMSFK